MLTTQHLVSPKLGRTFLHVLPPPSPFLLCSGAHPSLTTLVAPSLCEQASHASLALLPSPQAFGFSPLRAIQLRPGQSHSHTHPLPLPWGLPASPLLGGEGCTCSMSVPRTTGHWGRGGAERPHCGLEVLARAAVSMDFLPLGRQTWRRKMKPGPRRRR